MQRAKYDDAVVIARILDLNVENVWPIIRGMRYSYYADLKVAVLNSPVHPKSRGARRDESDTGKSAK
jgi:hypothetical protein